MIWKTLRNALHTQDLYMECMEYIWSNVDLVLGSISSVKTLFISSSVSVVVGQRDILVLQW